MIFNPNPKFTPKPFFSLQILSIHKVSNLKKRRISSIEIIILIAHDLKKLILVTSIVNVAMKVVMKKPLPN
jgi:hypothetical protein